MTFPTSPVQFPNVMQRGKVGNKYQASFIRGNAYNKSSTEAIWISYLLFNLPLLQWSVLWEPSANDLAADEPLRPIGLPEWCPVPGGCWGAHLPLHAQLLRHQMWQNGHCSLPGAGWVCGAARRKAPSHCAYFITGMANKLCSEGVEILLSCRYL